jgi:hypothetical protein
VDRQLAILLRPFRQTVRIGFPAGVQSAHDSRHAWQATESQRVRFLLPNVVQSRDSRRLRATIGITGSITGMTGNAGI